MTKIKLRFMLLVISYLKLIIRSVDNESYYLYDMADRNGLEKDMLKKLMKEGE